MDIIDLDLDPIERLTRDLKAASVQLGDDEARFLVDAYYIMQEDRKRYAAQVRTLEKDKEPNEVIKWFLKQALTMEKQIYRALDAYASRHIMGEWLYSVYGVGPVISAGLVAHIDIEKCPTVGRIFSFAGIAADGQAPWEKGKKRPFNADLKILQWKIGQSFMKFHNIEACYYGNFYSERKKYENTNNDAGRLSKTAALRMDTVGKTTEAYKYYSSGKLPPGHIDGRARRYAVKMFLSDFHAVWYFLTYNKMPPAPFVIEHLGHIDWHLPYNIELVPGMLEAYRAVQPVAKRRW